MFSSKMLSAVFGLCVATGCGSSPDPKSSDNVDVDELSYVDQEDAPADDSVAKVPERCVKRGNACVPALSWALSVCEDVYEDLALYMFREGTPWSRFYLKTGLNAVNGWGTTLHEDMVSREEVLVINHRLSNSFQVEGSGGTYDVLRWNGSCVTVDVNEVTPKAPYKPRNSRIEWRALSNEMREALLKDDKVATTHEKRRKACKGASVGRATKQCEELDKYFMEVVADAVRHTEDLPPPSRAPSLPARSARN